MKRTTIKDLARLLNVAPSTVSRALSDHPDISESTKSRVKALAKELSYQPNHIAVNFRKQNSTLIALILPEITMFFFPQVIKAVEAAVRSKGFSLIVLHSQNSLELERENLELCTRFSVDGILLSLSKDTVDLDHVYDQVAADFPLVLFDRVLPDSNFSTLTINDQEVAQQAVEVLIEKGHKRICGMFGYDNLQISKERYRGFIHAMDKHQLAIDPSWILNDRHENSDTNDLIKLMSSDDRPTAIFAMSDELLVGIYQSMAQIGLRIPEDVAVICISEGYIPNFLFPKVTYVQHSGVEVGTKASEMLLQLLEKEKISILKEQIIPQLVMQQSV